MTCAVPRLLKSTSHIFNGLDDLIMENKGEKEGNHRFGKYQARQIKKQCRKNTLQIIFLKQKQRFGQVGKN